jgi:hypothetical protein
LAAVAENPADVEHVFDLLSRSYATPAADTARACLRADPHIAPLLATNSFRALEATWGLGG